MWYLENNIHIFKIIKVKGGILIYRVSNINTDFLPKFEFLWYLHGILSCFRLFFSSFSDDTFINKPTHTLIRCRIKVLYCGGQCCYSSSRYHFGHIDYIYLPSLITHGCCVIVLLVCLFNIFSISHPLQCDIIKLQNVKSGFLKVYLVQSCTYYKVI